MSLRKNGARVKPAEPQPSTSLVSNKPGQKVKVGLVCFFFLSIYNAEKERDRERLEREKHALGKNNRSSNQIRSGLNQNETRESSLDQRVSVMQRK